MANKAEGIPFLRDIFKRPVGTKNFDRNKNKLDKKYFGHATRIDIKASLEEVATAASKPALFIAEKLEEITGASGMSAEQFLRGIETPKVVEPSVPKHATTRDRITVVAHKIVQKLQTEGRKINVAEVTRYIQDNFEAFLAKEDEDFVKMAQREIMVWNRS